MPLPPATVISSWDLVAKYLFFHNVCFLLFWACETPDDNFGRLDVMKPSLERWCCAEQGPATREEARRQLKEATQQWHAHAPFFDKVISSDYAGIPRSPKKEFLAPCAQAAAGKQCAGRRFTGLCRMGGHLETAPYPMSFTPSAVIRGAGLPHCTNEWIGIRERLQPRRKRRSRRKNTKNKRKTSKIQNQTKRWLHGVRKTKNKEKSEEVVQPRDNLENDLRCPKLKFFRFTTGWQTQWFFWKTSPHSRR